MAILPLSFRFNENAATIRFKRTYLSGILFLLGSGWAGLYAPKCKLSIQEFPLRPFRPSKAEVLAGSLRFSCEFPQPVTRVSGRPPGWPASLAFVTPTPGLQGCRAQTSENPDGRAVARISPPGSPVLRPARWSPSQHHASQHSQKGQ